MPDSCRETRRTGRAGAPMATDSPRDGGLPLVDSMPTLDGERGAPEPLPGPVMQLMEEVGRLLEASLAPAAFFEPFLQRTLAALGAVAAAVWVRTPRDNFQLEHQLNLAAVGLDQ